MRPLWFAVLPLVACSATPSPKPCPATPAPEVASAPAPSTSVAAPPLASAPAPAALDEKAVSAATGVEKLEKSPDGTLKASWPRTDVDVIVDGTKMPPFMGLTSWVAFSPGKSGVESMVMGDLVLFEDEVNPVMSKLLDAGVEVTALHNHFFFDQPKVFFMHVGGEGKVEALGNGVRAAMEETKAIRKANKLPANSFGSKKLPPKSAIGAARLDSAFGTKGTAKDGMYKAVFGRKASAACGCVVGKAMGVNTWAAFAGTDDDALVDGDFAVSEQELQPVLKSLRAGGINVVAIHHHMTGETPRVLFLHYWGRGKAIDLAGVVKRTLDLTAWDKPSDA